MPRPQGLAPTTAIGPSLRLKSADVYPPQYPHLAGHLWRELRVNPCRLIWTRRALALELARREFAGRYRDSFGGVLWSFVQPLFLLAVYTLAFGVILQVRPFPGAGTSSYALTLFAGLILFNAFSEILRRAPTLISSSPNYVKKVVFPLEILPWVLVIAVLAHALIGVGVWTAGYLLLVGLPHSSWFWFPIVLLAFLPVLLGTGWLLAALGVLVRDVEQLTGMVSHALLFLTPIFYDVDSVPALLGPWLMANPLTFIVTQLRLVLFVGQEPDFVGLAIYFLVGGLYCGLAFLLFRRLRPAFADLL